MLFGLEGLDGFYTEEPQLIEKPPLLAQFEGFGYVSETWIGFAALSGEMLSDAINKLKNRVRYESEFTCFACGKQDYRMVNALDGHHRYYLGTKEHSDLSWRASESADAITILCHSCHKSFHASRIAKIKEIREFQHWMKDPTINRCRLCNLVNYAQPCIVCSFWVDERKQLRIQKTTNTQKNLRGGGDDGLLLI